MRKWREKRKEIKKNKKDRIKRYLEIFEKVFQNNKNILSKNYNITIVRSIIIYFVYRENEFYDEKLTYQDIAEELGMERSAVTKAYHRIETIFNDLKILNSYNEKEKQLFNIFYYIFKINYIKNKNI